MKKPLESKKKRIEKVHYGLCRDCKHSYMEHEVSFSTHRPFLCKCRKEYNDELKPPIGPWGKSFFLNHECETMNFELR